MCLYSADMCKTPLKHCLQSAETKQYNCTFTYLYFNVFSRHAETALAPQLDEADSQAVNSKLWDHQ